MLQGAQDIVNMVKQFLPKSKATIFLPPDNK